MSFDPYRKWLGIPSNRLPPNYYDLLGITAGEKDSDVIRSAINQRRMYILSKKGEGQDGHVKVILRLIEEATSTLLVPEFKHGYDRQLGLHLKKKGSRRSYVLPSWMESQVVRIYGEGSGIVGDLFGIVSILLAAFGLMAWWSFRLQNGTIDETQVQAPEPMAMEQATEQVAPQIADKPAPPPVAFSSAIAAGETDVVSFTAITISIDEKGNGKFTADTRPVGEAHKFNEPLGQPVTIKAMEPASAYKLEDGRLHLRYDFSKIRTLDGLKSVWPGAFQKDYEKQFETLSIDSDAEALVLNPLASGNSTFNLPRASNGIFDLRILLSGMSEKYLAVQLNSGMEKLLLGIHGIDSLKEDPATVTLTYRGGENAQYKNLVKFTQANNEKKDQDFRVNANFQKEMVTATIAYWGNLPIALPMIDVVANYPPPFGIKLSQKGSKVIAEQIISESGAEKAGLKPGDVLISINGKVVKDVATSMSLLAKYSFDQVAELEVERFGKKQSFQVNHQ